MIHVLVPDDNFFYHFGMGVYGVVDLSWYDDGRNEWRLRG